MSSSIIIKMLNIRYILTVDLGVVKKLPNINSREYTADWNPTLNM